MVMIIAQNKDGQDSFFSPLKNDFVEDFKIAEISDLYVPEESFKGNLVRAKGIAASKNIGNIEIIKLNHHHGRH